MQVIFKSLFFRVFLFVLFFVVPIFVWAQLPVVPGSDPSQIDTIPGLISYIYNLAFWIVGIAVFFSILWGAFTVFFTAAGSASKIGEAKKRITNAIIGLILLFSSWLILNVINPDLVKNTFDFGALLQGGGSTGGNPLPSVSGGAGGSTSPTPIGPPIVVAQGGYCDAKRIYNGCSNFACAQWLPAINQYASGPIASANLLKAIMFHESACGENPTVKAGRLNSAGAGGLMQFLVPTAKIYGPKCGVPGSQIDANWLTNRANFNTQICMSAKFFNEMGGPSTECGKNGGNIQRHAIAGYNGGPNCTTRGGACCRSNSCTGLSCDGSPTRKWECTVGSNGFQETRNYVQGNLYCIQNPGF